MAPDQFGTSGDQPRGWEKLAFYQKALDQAAIVAVTDARGQILYVNDKFCEISGYSRDELVGEDHRLLNSGHHAKRFFKEMYSAIARGQTWRGEIRNRAKDGSFYWVDTTIVPMIGDSGKPSHFVAIRQDITDRKRIERQLAEAKRTAERATVVKDRFLANMSHEIRTPMTAILGFLELLRDPGLSESRRDELLEVIERNGAHLLALINDILDLSKVGAGQFQLESAEVCPISVIERVYSSFRQKAEAKGIALSCSFDASTPRVVMTDTVRLTQVLNNLMSNALKFTEAGNIEIWCGAGPDGNGEATLSIEVRDTGIGMTPEQLGRVFEAFEQADVTITRRFGGTGLGLSISRRLVSSMGGRLVAESEIGRGSTFRLSIPVGLGTSEVERADTGSTWERLRRERSTRAVAAKSHAGALSGVRVLLVDDAPDNVRLIGHHLRKAGAMVVEASNGQDAVEFCLRERPDIVLMDVQMPVLDGLSATRQLRARGVATPIVAVTANAMREDRERCMHAGCSEYLSKPIAASELIECCLRQLGRGTDRSAA